MPADIIIYALIAAGLVFWLRSILGTRDDDEPQRPSAHTKVQKVKISEVKQEQALDSDEEITPLSAIKALAAESVGSISIDNKTAEHGLLEIAKVDKKFDISQFMNGAQDAFVIVVEAFAEGDRETLKGLLDKPVFEIFDGAITEREEREETAKTEIHAVKKAEITKARLDKKMAYVTVRFTADETSVARDKADKIISGDPDKITKMRDLWVFGRSVNSKNPAWLVYETSDDLEDDNDLIPNTN